MFLSPDKLFEKNRSIEKENLKFLQTVQNQVRYLSLIILFLRGIGSVCISFQELRLLRQTIPKKLMQTEPINKITNEQKDQASLHDYLLLQSTYFLKLNFDFHYINLITYLHMLSANQRKFVKIQYLRVLSSSTSYTQGVLAS